MKLNKNDIKNLETLIKNSKNYTLSTSIGDIKFIINGSKLNIIFDKKLIDVMTYIIDICDDLEYEVDDKYINNNIVMMVKK